ncbi:zf-HC2 domain-containing protein [Modestobacter sp. Leaf380]|uniref:anti-sigma factor n=1 Tax=Modestobacter sp. Leaf380 TaxID=1736356 RepID=UPI0006F624BA|nr:zf-HC2 domain-containing protein [Modestobacter sp. Leaf380]KQS68287.1 hypothetical protein ASG41_04585 [Modestobacter sp. Leaf380]
MNVPETHLAQEAIAALVDGELSGGAAGRAARHLTGCLQCRLAVQAQREAKDALHGSHDSQDVAVPGDLLSRLRAIPFTADVSATGPFGGGTLLASALTAPETPERPGQARWLRRGVAAGLTGLGLGVVALAVSLPAPDSTPVARTGPDSGSVTSTTGDRTELVPPVVRTVTVGTTTELTGGTP